MGVFNEQTYSSPFAKGIQGAPGVGFSLTADGNYDLNKKRLTNVGAPSANTDAATKKYVDDNSSSSTSELTVDSNIDMKDRYRILNLKHPVDADEPATKQYSDSKFLDRDGSRTMIGNLDMNSNKIFNLTAPTGPKQPIPLVFGDLKYLHVAGTNKMTNNLNMDNKGIIHLKPPTSDTDAATKKYVDDNAGSPDLSDYFKKDGSVAMTGNLNMNNKKIINLLNPTQDKDVVNKTYTDHLVHHTAIQPSHYTNQFAYLMSSAAQWTDETNGGNSFLIDKIGILTPSNGNFHDYNHKVIYYKINKNSQGGYNYKMGMNFYRLHANTDYTFCLELLNTEYLLWHKSQISVDKGNSSGLTLGNVSIKKLSHKYTDSGNQTKFMYYYKLIINFRKLATGNRFFLHVNVNIPQTGIDLNVYPNQFKGCYMIAYGIVGTFSNIDPDKVYDYHTAFDIKPTEVYYNVDINANNKKIFNVNLDRSNNNSVATVAMVKELYPFTADYLYRSIFEEIYDFSNAANYKISPTSSGITFNKLSSSSGNILRDMDITNKTIDNIKKEGLNVDNYTVSFSIPNNTTNFTLCLIFYHWRNRSFGIYKRDKNNRKLISLEYKNLNNQLILDVDRLSRSVLSILSSFSGKKNVIWLTQSSNNNLTRAKINNYNSLLSVSRVLNANEQKFEFTTQDGVLCKIMFSSNFYNTDSENYHKVMLQEKIDGSYIV